MKLLLENWQKLLSEDTAQAARATNLWGYDLSPDKKYFISSKPFTTINNMTQGMYHPWAEVDAFRSGYSDADRAMPMNYKPRGLWYACGGAWIDWLRDNAQSWLSFANYLYEVQISESVLRITSKSDLMKFTKVYNNKKQEQYGKNADWSRVQGDGYTGIEICPYDKDWSWHSVRKETIGGLWFGSWDAASGCIWDEAGIQSITLAKKKFDNVNILSPSFSEDMAYIEKMSPNEVEQNKYEIISRLRGPTDEDQYDEYLDEIHAHGLGKQPSGYMFYGTGGPDPGQGDVDAFYNTETNSWQDFTDEDTFTRYFVTLDGSLIIDKRSVRDQGTLQRAKEKGVIIF